MLCPRWDSNCIPALANTGPARKNAESGPIRLMYDPIRDAKCGRCTHPEFILLMTRGIGPGDNEGFQMDLAFTSAVTFLYFISSKVPISSTGRIH